MTAIIFLFIGFSVLAESFQYRLEGSFPSNATTINYSVNWNETSTTLQGLYQDNLYAKGPATVTGTVSTSGRRMTIILPTETLGVRQIILKTLAAGSTSGSVPIAVSTQDNIGRTVDSVTISSLMTTEQAASDPASGNDDSCIIGFGALTGYCGLYGGSFNEISDNRNRCDLLSSGNPRLELAADTTFRLLLNYIPGAPNPTLHNIGSFFPSPQSNTINVTSRNCSVMAGTTFVPNNCKTINLDGIFFNQADTLTFSGTYSIADEINADACTYTMSLTREVTY